MNALAEAAQDYTRRGWRVVPLRGKNPAPLLGADWPHKASSTPAAAAGWWARWPDANVGVIPDTNFLAIDVDPRHGGHDDLHHLERKLGELPTTPAYLTGGPDNGWRLLLAHPGVDVKPNLADGIELRDRNRQIVMPPSVHPDTGNVQHWDVDLDTDLAEIPADWLDHMRKPVAAPPPSSRSAARTDRNDDPLLDIDAATYIYALTGRTPDSRGYVRCPFHKNGDENRPDLKLYGTTWACFACPGPGPNGKLGGGIYQFAGLVWGYPIPLRGPAFLAVQERLYDVMLAHLAERAA